MIDLKQYFHNKYQGGESFVKNVILPIFGEDKYEDAYEEDVLENNPELTAMAASTGITSLLRMGTINIPMNPTDVFDITVTDHVQMKRNRVAVQQLVRRIMSTYSSAFMVFHYEDDDKWDWRFTFCSKQGNSSDATDSKRYTFLLGPNQSCRTAADNFTKLLHKGGEIELKDIKAAFDVEALSEEFFGKYKLHYERFVEYVTGKRYVKSGGKWEEKVMHDPHPQMYRDFGENDKRVRDYVKKMLGRIVFLHYLQKKGWMGVPEDKQWGDGDTQFMRHLYECATPEQQADFLDTILEPLFTALDTDRTSADDLFDTHVALEHGSRVKVPYLNGGLFERDKLDEIKTQFPAEYFHDLFDFFYQYNFTIDENDPDDAQVGVDPEMLGRIFENLLEDNKEKGAFYTPKEIVRYMCRQSLTAYLNTGIKDETQQKAVEEFVNTYNVTLLGGANSELAQSIDQRLKDVKICDPAIGSGAFPIGLLKELFLCRGAIEDFDNAAAIKRHIIQQNIYGVDIERGAIDIARLRFWLSLVVDEETPHTLPNLDFKIMQGNSLLEQYQGVDLSDLDYKRKKKEKRVEFDLFDTEADYYRKMLAINKDFYFSCDNQSKKKELRKNITEAVKKQLEALNYDVQWGDIDLMGNDRFFLWHTWFDDVFNRPSGCNGFDIVIGNPPYIQLQEKSGELATIYAPCKFKTFARTGDIYCLFYERGYQLLKQGGHLCYITSNKWMRAGYGEKTREFFAKNTDPQLLIDFAGVKIFESATVDTNILLFAKADNRHNTLCAVTNKQNKDSVKNLSVFVQQSGAPCDFSGSDSWVILSPIEQSIKRKIEAVGTPLKDWDIQINYGIKTGYNEAFIIDTAKREEILSRCADEDERARTAELIRPILRGRDIKRYGYNWAGLYLIATFPSRHYDIDEYPAVKEYLLSYGIERLEQTGKTHIVNGEKIKARKKTNNKWFETQDSISYLEDFSKPKILWKRVGSILRFAYNVNGSWGLDSTCFSIGDDVEYICCVLNSPMGHYLLKDSPKTGTGDLLVSVQAIEPLRIPHISEYENKFFRTRLERLINEESNALEQEINQKVFDLYDLSLEERTYILENFS